MTKTVFFPFFHTISYYNHIISSQIRLVKSFSTCCGYNINMKFGKTLKELREEKGLSQMELARATGISQSAIAKWEKGKTEPTSSSLITLSHFFGESVDFLLGNDDFSGGDR